MLDLADSPKLSWAGYLRKRIRGWSAPERSLALQYSAVDCWGPEGEGSLLAPCSPLRALYTSLLAQHSFVVEMMVSVRVGGRRQMGRLGMFGQQGCPYEISGRFAGFRTLE